MKEHKQIPVLLLTGYLGSGKTTLLNRILHNKKGIRFAVIVNDIGEVNIDADMIQRGGVVNEQDGDLVALQNGCICCTLKTDLIRQIDTLLAAGIFDYIVIEASGICEPQPIAMTICQMEAMISPSGAPDVTPRLDCIVSVVDALRLKSEFASGDSLTRNNIDEEDIENLIIQQIEFCNLILLNKISEVSPQEAGRIRAVIKAIQPKAKIIECDYCDVPLSELLDTHLFDFEKTVTSAAWIAEIEKPLDELDHHSDHDHNSDIPEHDHNHHHEHDHGHHHHHHEGEGEAEEYGISTFVYFRRRPFDFNKFDRFVNLEWPSNIIRAKGVVYFSHNTDMSILFEQAGVQKKISESGLWYATAPDEELEQILLREPGLRRDWDEEYGDRMIKLVFIGRNIDRAKLTRLLDDCLAK